ncbi:hypothetical protein [Xanthomonas nasturtii]|nr:hypothetical protein [Xanthomonas nasturtii]
MWQARQINEHNQMRPVRCAANICALHMRGLGGAVSIGDSGMQAWRAMPKFDCVSAKSAPQCRRQCRQSAVFRRAATAGGSELCAGSNRMPSAAGTGLDDLALKKS